MSFCCFLCRYRLFFLTVLIEHTLSLSLSLLFIFFAFGVLSRFVACPSCLILIRPVISSRLLCCVRTVTGSLFSALLLLPSLLLVFFIFMLSTFSRACVMLSLSVAVLDACVVWAVPFLRCLRWCVSAYFFVFECAVSCLPRLCFDILYIFVVRRQIPPLTDTSSHLSVIRILISTVFFSSCRVS